MALTITDADLQLLKMDKNQFKIELACHFYQIGKMSIGQASTFTELDRISFQTELSKRKIAINYTVQDLHDDMETLNKLGI